MSKNILYTKPSITKKEESYALEAIKNGWGEQFDYHIKLFEKKFLEFTKSKYSVATSSCTGALHLGLAALGLTKNDEVIIADINWIASVAPIIYLGATPIFVDIQEDTWCIDPDSVERAITEKTKAIIAVHLYGNLCNMDMLLSIGKKYNIPIIEDAAEAIGSHWGNKHAGTLGLFGVFSFHGSKTMTTGEGGMLITNNFKLYQNVITLNNHGRKSPSNKFFWPEVIGFKYKISNIQAAIGCAQLERISDLIKKKREIFFYYKNKLDKTTKITTNIEISNTVNSFWMPTIIFCKSTNINKESALAFLERHGISARPFFYPLSKLPIFNIQICNTIAYSISPRGINLPSYHDITKNQQDKVLDTIFKLIDS